MDSWKAIANMTNKEAAAVIKNSMLVTMCSRAHGKTLMATALSVALIKAIAALENMPDSYSDALLHASKLCDALYLED